MALVGSSVVVGKIMVARLPVFLVAGLRFTLASLILVPLVLARERGLPRLQPQDLGVLALQSFTGIFAFNTLLLYGLTLTSAAESGIVTSTTPAVAGALSVLFLRERLGRGSAAGLGLAVLGLLAINVPALEAGARGADPLLGNLLVFGAVLGEATYVVCGKVATRRLSPLLIATGITVLGLAMFLPFALWEAWRFDFSTLGLGDWLAVLYYGVAVTVVAFVLWSRGLIRVPASTAAVFTGVLPVSAVALSYAVLGERFLWSHLVGGACVIAAILLVARPEPRAS